MNWTGRDLEWELKWHKCGNGVERKKSETGNGAGKEKERVKSG